MHGFYTKSQKPNLNKFCWDCGVGLQSITTSVLLPVFKLSRPDCKANELINGVLTLAYLTSTLPVVTLCYLDQWTTQQLFLLGESVLHSLSLPQPGPHRTSALQQLLHHHHPTAWTTPATMRLMQLRNMSQLSIVGDGDQGELVHKCKPYIASWFGIILVTTYINIIELYN